MLFIKDRRRLWSIVKLEKLKNRILKKASLESANPIRLSESIVYFALTIKKIQKDLPGKKLFIIYRDGVPYDTDHDLKDWCLYPIDVLLVQ